MWAINPLELPKFVGILEIRTAGSTWPFTRLACVRGLVATVDTSANTVEVNADDCGTVFSGNRPWITIEAELLEDMGVDTIELLLGWLNRTNVAGTPVSITGEVIQAGAVVVPKGTVYNVVNKNWANTVVSSIVIDDNVTPLVLNTNYTVNVDTNGSVTGRIGTTYITFLTATSWLGIGVNIDYSYTPNASEQVEIDSSFTENALFEVKITATNDSKDRIITLTPARFEAPYNMNFLDVVEAGDITGATLTFIWEKDSKLTYKNEII